MSPAWLLIVLTTVPGQTPVAKDDTATQQAARAKRERLLEIYASTKRREIHDLPRRQPPGTR